MRYLSIFVAVFIAWFGWGLWVYQPLTSLPEFGAFGDSFGVLSSLFSGLAFAGLIVTILQQQKQLNSITKEQERTATLLDEQLQIARATARLNYLNTMLDHVNQVIKNSPDNGSGGSAQFAQDARYERKKLWEERERLSKVFEG